MTREEREYFVQELNQMFDEWAGQFVPDAEEKYAAFVKTFEDKYMQKLSGQNPFPQDLFRVFLRQTGAALTPDDKLSYVSENSVQNKVLAKEFDKKSDIGHTHSQISNGSTVISTTENKAVITASQTEINSRNGRVVCIHSGNSGSDSYINLMLENGGTVYLSLNGINVGDELKLFDQMAYRFDLVVESNVIETRRLLPKDFCKWIAELYNEYLLKGDGEGYDGSKLLLSISGAQIHITHPMGYVMDGAVENTEHYLHFKPWTLTFHQKITEYSTSTAMHFVPVLEIKIGDDAMRFIDQIYRLSDVRYLRINNDNLLEWLFINSSNEQVGSFTIQ